MWMRSERFLRTSSLLRFVLVPPPNPSQYICFQPKLPVESITNDNDKFSVWISNWNRHLFTMIDPSFERQEVLSFKSIYTFTEENLLDSRLSRTERVSLLLYIRTQWIQPALPCYLFKIQCTFKYWLHTHMLLVLDEKKYLSQLHFMKKLNLHCRC